jgi:hypothetical protein
MNCTLLEYVVSGDYFVPAGTPVRILSFVWGEGGAHRVVCLASFAQSSSTVGNIVQRDVNIMVEPEKLRFKYFSSETLHELRI